MTYFADLSPYTYLEHDDPPDLPTVNVGWLDAKHPRGNGEIRVRDDKVVYTAPVLVVHYLTAHDYLPPEAFTAAAVG